MDDSSTFFSKNAKVCYYPSEKSRKSIVVLFLYSFLISTSPISFATREQAKSSAWLGRELEWPLAFQKSSPKKTELDRRYATPPVAIFSTFSKSVWLGHSGPYITFLQDGGGSRVEACRIGRDHFPKNGSFDPKSPKYLHSDFSFQYILGYFSHFSLQFCPILSQY